MDEEETINEEVMIAASVTIRQKHKAFLEQNPDINFSGLVRKWLDKEIQLRKTNNNIMEAE